MPSSGIRYAEIDRVRGLAVVLMTLDHARLFFLVEGEVDPIVHTDAGLVLYLTRWITHFCAPAFLFLAGVSAGLKAATVPGGNISAYLLKRGLWLVFLEILVISFAWSFAPFGIKEFGGAPFIFLQVLWAIGLSMIVLSFAHRAGKKVCIALGLLILTGHNLLDPVWPDPASFGDFQPFWVSFHAETAHMWGSHFVLSVYPFVPWLGLMLLGFGVSPVFSPDHALQSKSFINTGLLLLTGFVLLRASNLYGDPVDWTADASSVVQTAIQFVNVAKYPPSLLFMMVTLALFCFAYGLADKVKGHVARYLDTVGRVPLVFYVVHFYLIHLMAVALGVAQGFQASQLMTFFPFFPGNYGVSLPWVFVLWGLVLALMWPISQHMANLKRTRRHRWLSYV